jgi:hypothetical protein
MLDLFTSAFSAKIDKKKKTNFGVILSNFIILISFAYLCYLLANYFSGNITPSIT